MDTDTINKVNKLPVLYSWYKSSCSWRVRIALNIKKVEYELRTVDLLKNEQNHKKFLQINPMGQVPVLVINNLTLSQSSSIIEYIDSQYPGIQLLPKCPVEKFRVREVCELIGSGIQPIQNLSVQYKHSSNAFEQNEWAKYWILKGLNALDILLKSFKSTNYCCGENLTMADCFLVPQVENAIRFGANVTGLPIVMRIYKNLSRIPEFENAHALNQSDCPNEYRQKYYLSLAKSKI